MEIVYSLEQTCIFRTFTVPKTSYGGTFGELYACEFENTKLLMENEPVTTNTENPKKTSEVKMVVYAKQSAVKHIPSEIFAVFSNLEYFLIYPEQQFELLKPFHLKNAKRLKVFEITYNDITTLLENSFIEATNLEHINLKGNKITKIHKMAFKGLTNLNSINLELNKIQFLHPNTFGFLHKIADINLLNNICIHKQFSNSSFSEISTEINKVCDFEYSFYDVLEVTVEKEIINSQKFKMVFMTLLKMEFAINRTEELLKMIAPQHVSHEIDPKKSFLKSSEPSKFGDIMVQLDNSNILIENLNKKVMELEENLKQVEKSKIDSENFHLKLSQDVKTLSDALTVCNQSNTAQILENHEKLNKNFRSFQNETLTQFNEFETKNEQLIDNLIQEKSKSLQENFEVSIGQFSNNFNEKIISIETSKPSQEEIISSNSYFNSSLTILADKLNQTSVIFEMNLLKAENKCSDQYLVLMQNMHDQKKTSSIEIDHRISEKVKSFDDNVKTIEQKIAKMQTEIDNQRVELERLTNIEVENN